MPHVDLIFALSLLYGAAVSLLIAQVMATAANKNATDLAFTIREVFLVAMFLSTATLILFDIPDFIVYIVAVSTLLNIVSTLLLVIVLRSHLRWRREHQALLELTHKDDVFPDPFRGES